MHDCCDLYRWGYQGKLASLASVVMVVRLGRVTEEMRSQQNRSRLPHWKRASGPERLSRTDRFR